MTTPSQTDVIPSVQQQVSNTFKTWGINLQNYPNLQNLSVQLIDEMIPFQFIYFILLNLYWTEQVS